jgi:hypothetical protein
MRVVLQLGKIISKYLVQTPAPEGRDILASVCDMQSGRFALAIALQIACLRRCPPCNAPAEHRTLTGSWAAAWEPTIGGSASSQKNTKTA